MANSITKNFKVLFLFIVLAVTECAAIFLQQPLVPVPTMPFNPHQEKLAEKQEVQLLHENQLPGEPSQEAQPLAKSDDKVDLPFEPTDEDEDQAPAAPAQDDQQSAETVAETTQEYQPAEPTQDDQKPVEPEDLPLVGTTHDDLPWVGTTHDDLPSVGTTEDNQSSAETTQELQAPMEPAQEDQPSAETSQKLRAPVEQTQKEHASVEPAHEALAREDQKKVKTQAKPAEKKTVDVTAEAQRNLDCQCGWTQNVSKCNRNLDDGTHCWKFCCKSGKTSNCKCSWATAKNACSKNDGTHCWKECCHVTHAHFKNELAHSQQELEMSIDNATRKASETTVEKSIKSAIQNSAKRIAENTTKSTISTIVINKVQNTATSSVGSKNKTTADEHGDSRTKNATMSTNKTATKSTDKSVVQNTTAKKADRMAKRQGERMVKKVEGAAEREALKQARSFLKAAKSLAIESPNTINVKELEKKLVDLPLA